MGIKIRRFRYIRNLIILCFLSSLVLNGFLWAENSTLKVSREESEVNKAIKNTEPTRKIKEDDLLKRAGETIRISDLVVKFTGGIFGVLSLIFGVLGFLGFKEYFSSRKFKEGVNNLLKDYERKLNETRDVLEKKLRVNAFFS